jgi:hypothetical protein
MCLLAVLILSAGAGVLAQGIPRGIPQAADDDVKLPSGKSQRDAILKAEHERSLSDVDRILKLATELKAEMEKNDYHVLSLSALKKAGDIERLARKVRTRLRR